MFWVSLPSIFKLLYCFGKGNIILNLHFFIPCFWSSPSSGWLVQLPEMKTNGVKLWTSSLRFGVNISHLLKQTPLLRMCQMWLVHILNTLCPRIRSEDMLKQSNRQTCHSKLDGFFDGNWSYASANQNGKVPCKLLWEPHTSSTS